MTLSVDGLAALVLPVPAPAPRGSASDEPHVEPRAPRDSSEARRGRTRAGPDTRKTNNAPGRGGFDRGREVGGSASEALLDELHAALDQLRQLVGLRPEALLELVALHLSL